MKNAFKLAEQIGKKYIHFLEYDNLPDEIQYRQAFMEYIRNYANKLNEERIINLKKAGIDDKIISNTIIDSKTNYILNKFLITHFSK